MDVHASAVPAYALAIPVAVALAVAVSGRWPRLRDLWPVAGAAVLLVTVFSMLGRVTEGEVPTATLIEVSLGTSIVLSADAAGMIFALLASMLWLVRSVCSLG